MSEFSSWFESEYLNWQVSEGGRKSIDEFAKHIGASRPAVSSWLNGRREPIGENVDKIAEKLGPKVYDLLGLQRPEIYDPQLARLITAYDQATDEQKEALIRQAFRLIGFEQEE